MSNLLDTDWAIDYMNYAPQTVRRVEELRPQGIAISIISVAELYEGVRNGYEPERQERTLLNLLRTFNIIPLSVPICRIFGSERGRLRRAGTRIEDMDLLIGATALHHNLTLLTNNRRHFGRLPGLNIISV